MLTPSECKELVSRPGKFEGEARYIPYFHEVVMEGFADEDDGETAVIYLTRDDYMLFPELRGQRAIRLWYRTDGFVQEI